MKDSPSELLFNSKKNFKGEIKKVLKGYPKRSKNFSDKIIKKLLGPELKECFIKDGYAYLLRGAAAGQESGFYTVKYSKKETVESSNLDPNIMSFLQTIDGAGFFISTTTDLFTASSFSNGGKVYVIRVPVTDVYSFKSFFQFEKEYLIPDYVAKDEIIASFKYDKFKQIFEFLRNQVGLNVVPADLGVTEEEMLNPDLEHIQMLADFNNGAMFLDPVLKNMQSSMEDKAKKNPELVLDFVLNMVDSVSQRYDANICDNEQKKNVGRKIAIFADAHGLLEPVEAILNDIQSRGITEIYSLGDNIGLGPNPKEVLDLIEKHGVKSIAGNYEEHINIGLEPFSSYMKTDKAMNIEWMDKQITNVQKEMLKAMPHTIEIELGNKKVALCHFANDVRCDFDIHSTWTYGDAHNIGVINPYEQFMYTNSNNHILEIAQNLGFDSREFVGVDSTYERLIMLKDFIVKNKNVILSNPYLQGYVSYVYDPLFMSHDSLKQISDYDMIIQGHVHFNRFGRCPITNTEFYDVRGVGLGYNGLENDSASYIILTEREDGFDIEKVDIPYDRSKMEQSVLKLQIPNNTIKAYTNIR